MMKGKIPKFVCNSLVCNVFIMAVWFFMNTPTPTHTSHIPKNCVEIQKALLYFAQWSVSIANRRRVWRIFPGICPNAMWEIFEIYFFIKNVNSHHLKSCCRRCLWYLIFLSSFLFTAKMHRREEKRANITSAQNSFTCSKYFAYSEYIILNSKFIFRHEIEAKLQIIHIVSHQVRHVCIRGAIFSYYNIE